MATKLTPFPALSTDRLTLRAFTPADAAAFRAVLLAPGVTLHSNWVDNPTRAQGERFVRGMARMYPKSEGCAWAIEDRGTGQLIGAIRYNSFQKKWRCGDIGYELHPDHWGRGLMSEALAAVVACGHGFFRLNRIQAWTLPGNGASDRVLEKAGFRFEGVLRERAWFKGAFHDFRVFGRIASDPVSPAPRPVPRQGARSPR
jgi:ribosomal-protein-alanine N-acetyltransferase